IAKTRQQLQGLSTIIILVMSAIGGSMVPLFVMPAIMQKIAVVSVNYWGIQGFYDIFWRNLPIIEIVPKMSVLVGIGLIMTIISVRLFKKNILKLIYA
ncbi:MAG: ABC transporter permease, partial [Chlorobi bacterium]|nr:ABC transporter permease [Chlorobiota bacterium]